MFAFIPLSEADCLNVEVRQALRQDEPDEVRNLCVDGEADKLMQNSYVVEISLNEKSERKKNMNMVHHSP